MGKYTSLGRHLSALSSSKISHSFKEIEDLLGFPLPKSARLYRPWWANDKTHIQAQDGWIISGWKVDSINMADETVVFLKIKDSKERFDDTSALNLEITPFVFKDIARSIMSSHYRTNLSPGEVLRGLKPADMLSKDKKIVGYAKFLTMVKGEFVPPAKYSLIAEHVWFLEKIRAKKKFIIFGNDRRVPKGWLKKYEHLIKNIDFFFYDIYEKKLEKLN